MKTAVVLLGFGEPADPELGGVTAFLERIFLQNAPLESGAKKGEEGDVDAGRERARELARARGPGLARVYADIGGSPLVSQSATRAEALAAELRARGHDDTGVLAAYQYVEPFVADGVLAARAAGARRLVALPLYPLCGHSTTIFALAELRAAVEAVEGWEPDVLEIAGWHRHPDFVAIWADHLARWADARGLDVHDGRTELVFSIHGIPLKYLEGGNRYDRYADEVCEGVARALRVARYHMGYQNHTNRPIEWTAPDVEEVVRGLGGGGGGARRIVVVPIAFLHEQSETLAELDVDLREVAEGAGLDFHRAPVPHDDPRLTSLLADLVEARLDVEPASGRTVDYRRCLCRRGGLARCTNGLRLSGTVEL